MKKYLFSILTSFLFLFQSTAFAGGSGNHSHGPVSLKQVKVLAAKTLDRLISKKKIESSWEAITPNEPNKKVFKNGPEWVVTFDNPKASDSKKKTLYVFVSLDGRVLASNFSGN